MRHFKNSILDSIKDDVLQLEHYRDTLVHKVLTDPTLALQPNTKQFRAEILCLIAVLTGLINGEPADAGADVSGLGHIRAPPPACPKDLTAQVSVVIGTDIEDDEATRLCLEHIVSPGVDRRFRDVFPHMLGRLHSVLVCEHAKTRFAYRVVSNSEPDEVVSRLETIMGSLAASCIFEATGDYFLKLALKPYLHCERLMQLTYQRDARHAETLEVYPKQSPGDESNEVIRDLITVSAADRFTRTVWKTARGTTDYIFLISLLVEL